MRSATAPLPRRRRCTRPHSPPASARFGPRRKRLCRSLATDDYALQSMPDASPAKWHIAHTSWFFEEFVLQAADPGLSLFRSGLSFSLQLVLRVGGTASRAPERGLLSRPTIEQVWAYRSHVDEEMEELLEANVADARADAGRHRRACITSSSIRSCSSPTSNICSRAIHCGRRLPPPPTPARIGRSRRRSRSSSSTGGVCEIGHTGTGFCFDNELGHHRVFLEPYRLANRLATNGEYLQFIRDGGYEKPDFWLSDGWATVQREQWRHPLYWADSLDHEFTLLGERELDPQGARLRI